MQLKSSINNCPGKSRRFGPFSFGHFMLSNLCCIRCHKPTFFCFDSMKDTYALNEWVLI